MMAPKQAVETQLDSEIPVGEEGLVKACYPGEDYADITVTAADGEDMQMRVYFLADAAD